MQQTAQTVLVSHDQRSVKTSRGDGIVHDFKGQDGTLYATFSAPIANHAHALLNQPVTVQFNATEKNGYQNNTLLAVLPSGGSQTPTQAPAGAPAANTTPSGGKDEQIARAVAYKGCCELVAAGKLTPDNLFKFADGSVSWLLHGTKAPELVAQDALVASPPGVAVGQTAEPGATAPAPAFYATVDIPF